MTSNAAQLARVPRQLSLVPPPAATPAPKPRRAATAEPLTPATRALAHGAGALADAELLALLLDTPGLDLEPARQLLAGYRDLPALAEAANAHDLSHEPLAPAARARLLAALELARRLARAELDRDAELLDRPDAIASYLHLRYARPIQEVLGALFLDVRNRLIAERELFRGTAHRIAIDVSTVLREALRVGATGIALFHTHPSGDPAPSPEDLEWTRRLAEASDTLGIRLLDHIIVGAAGNWVSLQQRGVW